MALTTQQVAERCTAIMWPDDHAAQGLGIVIRETTPGGAVVDMKVRQDMVNGHGICHGGFIFTLADSTFAFACNSYNKNAVAAGCSIEFLRPGNLDDVLTCEGVEQTLQGRHGVYDMRVSNQKGQVVALFRGKSAQIQGTVIPDQPETGGTA